MGMGLGYDAGQVQTHVYGRTQFVCIISMGWIWFWFHMEKCKTVPNGVRCSVSQRSKVI